ncbi:Eco57I restriction-modification methylase domain-containing protein [Archangium sp.]|uniref:Eco57I restriction-modification methylase domain-containing protein n=1 Tax=Archangium sp. TaxID=1872627 RepID=UPI00286A416C|nr:Eco57I restriction-modification methylase domain-containing protein [Archangium sp.]
MQLQFNLPSQFSKDAYQYGERSSGETHGVVLTKPHVVNLILDLARYTQDRALGSMRILEPACGTGAFLVPAVERLLMAARRDGVKAADLGQQVVAYDIDAQHVAASRSAVVKVLQGQEVPTKVARRLAEQWVREGDFLLAQDGPFDVVVGNPPYIRIEQLAPSLQAEYRRRYTSLYDRADLYVAFIERGLDLLKPDGVLSFICADRWILNRYGAPLRKRVNERFKVHAYIDLHQASPFESEVIAYPSIFAIGPGKSERVLVGSMLTASPEECAAMKLAMQDDRSSHSGVSLAVHETWFQGDEPWVLSSPQHLETLRLLESRFPSLEADGATRVRIGVATGNDKIFIVNEDVDIESSRLVPLVKREDIHQGRIENAKRFVINTFDAQGKLIDLTRYPRLARYLDSHEDSIRKRHVAQKNSAGWFRTIDRVYPELVSVPKLLVPDIAGSNEVAFEEGQFHPHHNLYFIISSAWDLEVLGGLLSSKVALFFIWSYAVKMRGGYLRFQAQYLRRIRLPRPVDVPAKLQNAIRTAFRKRDFQKLDGLALQAYGLKTLPDFDFVDTRT